MRQLVSLLVLLFSTPLYADYFDFDTEFEPGRPGADCQPGEFLVIDPDTLYCIELGVDATGTPIMAWELVGGFEPDFGVLGTKSTSTPELDFQEVKYAP